MTGQFMAATPQLEKQLQSARKKIATSLLNVQPEDTGSEQLFVNADLYSRDRIESATATHIAGIATEAVKVRGAEGESAAEQFFIRSTPVLNPQVAGSVPEWAIGAKPVETQGPFLNAEGREIWIDFYRIEKLITLYIGTQPVMLFKASFRQGAHVLNGVKVELTREYQVVAGSFWLHASLIASASPADKFAGVEVKSGTVKLSETPTIQNNHLSIPAGVTISVSLQLVQGKDPDAAVTSAYGKDARDAKYQLPEAWEFTIQNNKLNVTKISDSSCEVFGQPLNFSFAPATNLATAYNTGKVLIPWKVDKDEFKVNKSVSPWTKISDVAPLKKTYWALPAATLDIINPIQANGNGAVWLQLDKGLNGVWTRLEDEEARFVQPVLNGEPGTLDLVDTAANLLGASQHFDLWKDKDSNVPCTADLLYQDKSALLFVSWSKGQEMIGTMAAATIAADRPVKVNGEPFPIRTISCSVILTASAEKRNVFLFEEEVMEAKAPAVAGAVLSNPIIRKSIALENALFTVSPVSSFILFGEADKAWKKITRANLFLGFHLYSYLPTLPDPYVGNLEVWSKLFSRYKDSQRLNSSMILICLVRYSPVNDSEDDVVTSFHFGGQPLTNFMELPGEGTKASPAPDAQPAPAAKTKARTASFGVMKSASRFSIKDITNKIGTAIGGVATTPAPKSEPILDAGIAADLKEMAPKEGGHQRYDTDTQQGWDDAFRLGNEYFSLLDVSSNANQLGISFGTNMVIVKTGDVRRGANDEQAAVVNNQFPFIVEGMQVKLPGSSVRTFALPLSAWEPEINLTTPDKDDNGNKLPMDPDAGFLYYANDGGPARIWNNNTALVPLAPIPAVKNIVEDFKNKPGNYTVAAYTLPFGLRAISVLAKGTFLQHTTDPAIDNIRPKFRKDKNNAFKFEGGIQLRLLAGDHGKFAGAGSADNDDKLFPGYTMQFNNLLNMVGAPSFASNLGHRVTQIFNNEFLFQPLGQGTLDLSRGVPVSKIDITGYGANMFSNWLSPQAAIAQTSQARFDVMMGRTGHEVIQVKSILYPWGIRVVRTITVFRTGSGYVYRTDSGWKPESEGRFDFSYKFRSIIDDDAPLNDSNYKNDENPEPYHFYPGVIKGLVNIRNIKDAPSVTEFTATNHITLGQKYLYGVTGDEIFSKATTDEGVICGGVYFDADIEIENVVQGSIDGSTASDLGGGKQTKYGRVVSKKILGYVQTAPAGTPLTPDQLIDLLELQNGSIGGELNCDVNVGNSDQQMHVSRFDVSASVDDGGAPVFVVAARGQVFLPKDGSWAMVQHTASSGEVTQLPNDVTVPLVRRGKWIKGAVIDKTAVKNETARIAHPKELLRAPGNDTINFGYLQTTGTQKALFLSPSYGLDVPKLLSKTPPLFADAYRLMTGNSIFPNIGNAIDNFGKAMLMDKVLDGASKVNAFKEITMPNGEKVLELLDVVAKKTQDAIIEQGMKLLQKADLAEEALKFAVPQLSEPIYLVKMDALKIYIEYKAKPDKKPSNDGKLNFDIDSMASEAGKQWKSKLENLAMVVDLAGIKRLMTIKGNFDSAKGKESGYEGGEGVDLPQPEIEFAPELKPVIEILQVLQSLSGGDYAETMKKGLKIAMSNGAEIWEYKFEANKEIALVRFPPTAEAYNSAQCPLKLEASLGLGVYFNAALKVTTDPSQLLPTAGAFLKFHGGLSVMCFSVGVGTIFAIGSVDVKIAADTAVGPNLTLKFGFGVQLVVSLPVVGSVSVTYMVGVEMYVDKTKVIVAAMMLFRGQANLLGGLVCVTITIEAKGIIERTGSETNCSAQVTFAIDISIFLVININFSKTWGESRQIA